MPPGDLLSTFFPSSLLHITAKRGRGHCSMKGLQIAHVFTDESLAHHSHCLHSSLLHLFHLKSKKLCSFIEINVFLGHSLLARSFYLHRSTSHD